MRGGYAGPDGSDGCGGQGGQPGYPGRGWPERPTDLGPRPQRGKDGAWGWHPSLKHDGLAGSSEFLKV